MTTVPREWREQHPFGPEANAARQRGELPSLFYTPKMAAWAVFARQNIHEGDILFRYGKSIRPGDRITTRVIAVASDSPFSHDALAHWEGDCLYVFDAELEGIRKVRFDYWILDVAEGTLAVRRLKPEYQSAIPSALAYVEDAYYRNVQFDKGLRLDDEKLYCAELIEKAFRTAGVCLSDPVRLRCLPRYARYGWLAPILERVTELRPDEPVFNMGNETYGLYASPCLESVYEGEAVRPRQRCGWKPLRCPPTPYPADAVSRPGSAGFASSL